MKSQLAVLCLPVYPTVWYGVIWYGMVWYGMVWYGMVWYGMVWYGMVWYGVIKEASIMKPSFVKSRSMFPLTCYLSHGIRSKHVDELCIRGQKVIQQCATLCQRITHQILEK